MDALVGRVARAGGGRGFILNWGIPFRAGGQPGAFQGAPAAGTWAPTPHAGTGTPARWYLGELLVWAVTTRGPAPSTIT